MSRDSILTSSRTQNHHRNSGASVFGLSDVHRKLAPFVAQWRAAGQPQLYAVAADVTRHLMLYSTCAPAALR